MPECDFCHENKAAELFGRTEPHPKFGMWCKQCERNRASIRKHGLTLDQKIQIAEYNGGCAICGHPDPGKKGWVVDHDHTCCDGEKSCPSCRRGVLCGYCNKMLAFAFDRRQTLNNAITYLERHTAKPCDWHMPVACAERMCEKAATA